MSIAEIIKPFFTSIKSFIMSKIRLASDQPPSSQLPSSSSMDPESQAVAVPIVAEQNHEQLLLQWQNAVMAFCFTSALEIATLFAQTKSQLPVSFAILSFAILLIFLSLFVANFIGHNFSNFSKVLELVAVILVATAVVFTIAIPLPPSFKCAAWALYAICLFTVLICRYLF